MARICHVTSISKYDEFAHLNHLLFLTHSDNRHLHYGVRQLLIHKLHLWSLFVFTSQYTSFGIQLAVNYYGTRGHRCSTPDRADRAARYSLRALDEASPP
jgi:hypothetical protein